MATRLSAKDARQFLRVAHFVAGAPEQVHRGNASDKLHETHAVWRMSRCSHFSAGAPEWSRGLPAAVDRVWCATRPRRFLELVGQSWSWNFRGPADTLRMDLQRREKVVRWKPAQSPGKFVFLATPVSSLGQGVRNGPALAAGDSQHCQANQEDPDGWRQENFAPGGEPPWLLLPA